MDLKLTMYLLSNAAAALSSFTIYSFFYDKLSRNSFAVRMLLGILSGILGVFILLIFGEGGEKLLNAIPVVVSCTGFFFGPLPVCAAVSEIGIALGLSGVPGLPAAYAILVLSAGTGLLWHRLNRKYISAGEAKTVDLYLFGIVTHLFMLACFLILPDSSALLKRAFVPVLLVYPLTSLLICRLYFTLLKKRISDAALLKSEARLRLLFEQTPVGIAIKNNGRILFCNKAFERITGRTSEEVNLCGWESFTQPEDYALEESDVDASGSCVYRRLIKPDGTVLRVYATHIPIDSDVAYNLGDSMCLIKDVTEIHAGRKKLDAAIESYKSLYLQHKRQYSLLRSVFDSTEDWIIYKDTGGAYMGCNKAFENFLGKGESEIIGRKPAEILDAANADIIMRADKEILKEKKPKRIEVTFVRPDGSELIIDMLKSPYFDEDGSILGIVCFGRDVTERRQREEKVLYISEHDALTGLHNRTYFQKQLEILDKTGPLPVSVLICDVNGLNLINDSFGHKRGDELLIAVAGVLQECRREKDIVCRIGGDEFIFLMPGTDGDEAKKVFTKIVSLYKERSDPPGSKLKFSGIAIGYAAKTSPEESLNDVIKEAEAYMYRRKLLAHKGIHSSILNSIKSTLYEKNIESQEHGERLAEKSRTIGRILGLSESDLDKLALASSFHDIGKIVLDRSVLSKSAKPTQKEWDLIKTHPEVGYRITQAIPELQSISEIVLGHHERWDGKGYPQGLSGEDIPLLARIIAIADAYDAMVEGRPYKAPVSSAEAEEEILRNAGLQFDPKIARLFVGYLREERASASLRNATNE